MKPIALVTVLAALTAAALVGATHAVSLGSAAGASATPEGSLTVTGLGTVETVPDRAQLSFDLQASGTTAVQALDRAAAESRAVNDALRAAGIARADLQTAQISLQPRRSELGTVTGFDATTTVTAKVKDLDRVGRVIDAAVRAGASGVYGPALTKSDTEALYAAALKAAVANARAKAQTIASASGLAVGRVTSVVEGGGTQPIPFAAADAAVKQSDVPLEPGTQEIQASVTVTFAAG
jgi:uncharacterized protein YggE